MKKKVLALVMSALAFSTIGAFAQTESSVAEPQQKECCKEKKENKDCKKGDKKQCKKGKGHFNPFEGIELTDNQKKQFDELRAEQKAKREADKKAMKESKEQERNAFNAEVEKILTPEQYAQYKANCEKKKAEKKDGKKPGKKDGKKHGKKSKGANTSNSDSNK